MNYLKVTLVGVTFAEELIPKLRFIWSTITRLAWFAGWFVLVVISS